MDKIERELVILGGGPGAYSAAFRAADLGKKVTIIEQRSTLGGVCLNVGCIPSKTLLHATDILYQKDEAARMGILIPEMNVDLDKLRKHKNSIVKNLTKGLDFLAKKREVEVITGYGSFVDDSSIKVATDSDEKLISFSHCIIAAGSRPVEIPSFPHDDNRMWNSTDALELDSVPGKMLVLGGGVIGLEMATVYNALGSEVTIIEMEDQIIPNADPDVAAVLEKRLKRKKMKILTGTKLESITGEDDGLLAEFGGKRELFDTILVSVGRKSNSDSIGLENTKVKTDDNGYIIVDETMKTSVENIYAVGDIIGQPMLAHKSSYEGKVAAEVIAGEKSAFIAETIPSVAYTIPEIAWTGLTEKEAQSTGIEYTIGKFPFSASGRAMVQNARDGFVKILFDKDNGRVIGGAIAGPHAGDMISEITLALEMGSDMEDISFTIHPHPTLGETICLAAEAANGTIVDL